LVVSANEASLHHLKMLTTSSTIFLHLITLSMICTAVPVAPLDPTLMLRGACSTAVKNLVSGINDNIAVQKNEQSQTTIIQKILSTNTTDDGNFQTAKSKLVTIVNQGITIRQNNQKIAPSGNAAIAGLATVSQPFFLYKSASC
jgi:hypothetical protein